MKNQLVKWLIVIASVITVLAMSTTAITNVKNFFNNEEEEDSSSAYVQDFGEEL